MRRRLVNSQISNVLTYQMYLRQLMTLAENVFKFKNLPENIDVSYMNKILVRNGAIAFFYDDVLDEILALPYTSIGKLDVYGRPTIINAIGKNGYSRKLDQDEYVIMYDNNGRYPIYLDVVQYAERIARDTKTADINIIHQRTPRFWQVPHDKEQTIRDLVNGVDGMENTILTYDNLNIDGINLILEPAPYVADKVDMHKDKEFNEFLRLIGISNLSITKKERQISDEIEALQGGTIASRYSRFEPRQRAVDEINEKFKEHLKEKIEVEFYDGEPSSDESKEEEGEKDGRVLMDANVDANDVSKDTNK